MLVQPHASRSNGFVQTFSRQAIVFGLFVICKGFGDKRQPIHRDCCKKHGHKTTVVGASLRNEGKIVEFGGCYYLTIQKRRHSLR